MSDFDDGERPRKRRINEGDKDNALRALLNEEIDLEIGLRVRLQETVESRLTWALVLQDALEKHLELSDGSKSREGPNHFADLAIAAYHATKGSADLFYPNEPPTPLKILENNVPPLTASDTAKSPVQEMHRPRHATRPHSQLHHEDRAVRAPNKYLYLRDSSATPVMVYKIACPDCYRSDFPRLQGLLNHCRLKHHREFGSHDECVQACAVIVPEGEQSVVMNNGLEVLGMSASLQRLFKMAVGSYQGIVAVPAREEAEELAKLVRSESHIKTDDEEKDEPAFVTKTLGHHKDTPALAPFLGRAPKKRQIHVNDDDKPLDIVALDDNVLVRIRRIPHYERGCVGEASEDKIQFDDDEVESTLNPSVNSTDLLKTYEGSRFHIPIRLIITDYSLRLPQEETKQSMDLGVATHKWMISLATASYSFHASTVLAKMSVACASEPPPSTFVVPLSVSDPPYYVMGTSDKPFLAQITLEWAGAWNKPTQLEHWVQLHNGKSTRPVKGDEQVLDVELDRHTEVLPRKGDTWKVDWSSSVDGLQHPIGQQDKASESSGDADPEWVQGLRKILQRFPKTAQDVGPRKPLPVPYFLPLTTQHFSGLVEGRRKAIEWGRARAVWEAYAASAREEDMESTMKLSGPIDVYRWMKAEGHFLNAASKSNALTKPNKPISDVFCAYCGLRPLAHRKGKSGRARDTEDGAPGRICEHPPWTEKMSIVDVEEFLSYDSQAVRRRGGPGALTGDFLVRLIQRTDPSLILGVQRVVSALHLSCFPSPEISMVFGTEQTSEQRKAELAPYLVLAASVRALIRLLVCGSLQVFETRPEGSAKPLIAASSGLPGPKKRLVVPVHVIRGLVEGSRKKGTREVNRAVLASMARLGVAVQDAEPLQMHADVFDHTPQIPTSAVDQGETHTSEIK